MSNSIQLLAHSLASRIPAMASDSTINNAYVIEKEIEECLATLLAKITAAHVCCCDCLPCQSCDHK